MIDDAGFAFAARRGAGFGDDLVERRRLGFHRARAGHAAERAEAHPFGNRRFSFANIRRIVDGNPVRAAKDNLSSAARSRAERSECSPAGCIARRRARSSSKAERRASIRLRGSRRCRDSRVRGADFADPIVRNASRSEKTRSFARDRSSSRRAPPMAASNEYFSSASSSAPVFSVPQQRATPSFSGCAPSAIAASLR